VAPPKGMFAGRTRSPKWYGARVFGVYYPPGAWLPRGTVDMEVRDIYKASPGAAREDLSGWLTARIVVPVGTSSLEISNQIVAATIKLLQRGTDCPQKGL